MLSFESFKILYLFSKISFFFFFFFSISYEEFWHAWKCFKLFINIYVSCFIEINFYTKKDPTLSGVFVLIASVSLFVGNIRAGHFIHAGVLKTILSSPMSFFEMTPVGRILNRFGKDLDVIDTLIAVNFQATTVCTLRVISTPVVIAYSTPLFCVVVIPLGILYFAIQVSAILGNLTKKGIHQVKY